MGVVDFNVEVRFAADFVSDDASDDERRPRQVNAVQRQVYVVAESDLAVAVRDRRSHKDFSSEQSRDAHLFERPAFGDARFARFRALPGLVGFREAVLGYLYRFEMPFAVSVILRPAGVELEHEIAEDLVEVACAVRVLRRARRVQRARGRLVRPDARDGDAPGNVDDMPVDLARLVGETGLARTEPPGARSARHGVAVHADFSQRLARPYRRDEHAARGVRRRVPARDEPLRPNRHCLAPAIHSWVRFAFRRSAGYCSDACPPCQNWSGERGGVVSYKLPSIEPSVSSLIPHARRA